MIDTYNKNFVLFGCGGTQKAVLQILDKYFKIDPSKLLIIDLINEYRTFPTVKQWLDRGSRYLQCDINKEYVKIVQSLNEGDIIIDLSNRTDSLKICEECLKNNIHYINTSLEDKLSPEELRKKYESLKTLYTQSHNELETLRAKYKDKNTNLLVFGMNPGLISVCTKIGLDFMSNKHRNEIENMNFVIQDKDYAKMCEYLEIEYIHCSEVDTQNWTDKNYKQTKIMNTWSCQSWLDEQFDNVQMTFGSNQRLPKRAEMVGDNIANMRIKASELYSESYVPRFGKIIGSVISHSESITASKYYSTSSYSPTCHYVYKYSPICWYSEQHLLNKSLKNGGTIAGFPYNNANYHSPNNYEDKFSGVDAVGALLISKNPKIKSVWCGSILSNKDPQIQYQNATTYQVALAICSGISWILKNPKKGVQLPEDVDHNYIMSLIKKDYGFVLEEVDYKPKNLAFQSMVRSKEEFDKQYK